MLSSFQRRFLESLHGKAGTVAVPTGWVMVGRGVAVERGVGLAVGVSLGVGTSTPWLVKI
jgi:hypothetical protein